MKMNAELLNRVIEHLHNYANAIVCEDHIAASTAYSKLHDLGFHTAGYVGAPLLCQGSEIVAQLTFNYTKKMTFRRVKPYVITYLVEIGDADTGMS